LVVGSVSFVSRLFFGWFRLPVYVAVLVRLRFCGWFTGCLFGSAVLFFGLVLPLRLDLGYPFRSFVVRMRWFTVVLGYVGLLGCLLLLFGLFVTFVTVTFC
jgi:hypothetical protein